MLNFVADLNASWSKSDVVFNIKNGKPHPTRVTRKSDEIGLNPDIGLVDSTRIVAKVEPESKIDYDMIYDFECTMLTQNNRLQEFNFRPILTIDIKSAKNLRAADFGKSNQSQI